MNGPKLTHDSVVSTVFDYSELLWWTSVALYCDPEMHNEPNSFYIFVKTFFSRKLITTKEKKDVTDTVTCATVAYFI